MLGRIIGVKVATMQYIAAIPCLGDFVGVNEVW